LHRNVGKWLYVNSAPCPTRSEITQHLRYKTKLLNFLTIKPTRCTNF
jgi:hypothetical protein